jgi:hypothetical protein
LNNSSHSSLITALAVSFLLGGGAPSANAQLFNNPYGATVSGTVFSEDPQVEQHYSNGDIYGSGTLTSSTNDAASVAGANASSSVSVFGNSLDLTARTNTPFNPGSGLGAATASADGAMWDTVSFVGATPGMIGQLTLAGNTNSDGIFVQGSVTVSAYNARVAGALVSANASISPVTTSVSIPLDIPLQIVGSANVYASSNSSGTPGYSPTDITFHGMWKFQLPAGVCISSASGVVYGPESCESGLSPLTPHSLSPGQAGMPYPSPPALVANLLSGGKQPYNVSGITGLPSGLSVDPQTGNVTGTIATQVTQTYSILGTVSDSSSPPMTVSVNSSLQIFCGNPQTNGDDRDVLIQEYIDNGVVLYPRTTPASSAPRCTDLTQQHPEFNVGTVDRLRWWMVWADAEVLLLNTWESYLSAWGTGPRTPISSGYRTPDNNFSTPGAATRSQHMFGKAIDMPTLNTVQDWTTAKDAANQAGRFLGYALWFEPQNGPCKLKCFHADVRNVSGAYLNP